MDLRERFSRTKERVKGRAINFRIDEVVLPDRSKALREFVEHPGAVCVLPFIDKKRIVLVEQFRYPVNEVTLEVPAGKLDKGESPLACVRRELMEETGFSAKKIKKVLSYWPTPAFSDEVIHIYTAGGLVAGEKSPDEDEFINTRVMTIDKALDLMRKGRIQDSKTVIALLLWYKNTHG
jgi:ADP-ribose pyrophosphatase